VGVNGAGSDRVDADAVRVQRVGQGLGQE
jgi:hypothetical protein